EGEKEAGNYGGCQRPGRGSCPMLQEFKFVARVIVDEQRDTICDYTEHGVGASERDRALDRALPAVCNESSDRGHHERTNGSRRNPAVPIHGRPCLRWLRK